MALPTYNASKHHIGLGASGGTSYGFMLEGGYTKEIQREKNNLAPELGGSTDLIGQTPSLARWTQDDFIGGMFAYNWGRDDAMFADCLGFMPAQQSRSLISCPPMHLKYELDAGSTIRSMFMVLGYIYIATPTTIHRYHIDTGSYDSLSMPGSDVLRFAEYDSQDQKIWTGIYTPGSYYPNRIQRWGTDFSLPATDAIYLAPTNTTGWSFPGGTIFNQFIVCQFGRKLFVGDPVDNESALTDGDIKWRKVTRLPGRWRDSLAYNNTLYILVNDGSFKSMIFAFDGDTVSPIVEFPFSFYAKCIIEYAGRIFVGGTGTDVNGNELYAELYEVTGSSVRLVRSFSPETRDVLSGGWPTSIDDLIVFEGLLWLCQKGERMVAYDITSDGFFGAAEIVGDSNLNFLKMVGGRGRIWAYGQGNTDGIYRIAQPVDGALASWNPTFVSSDFAYEIAMNKTWSEIQVMTRYGSVESLEYSVNSGESWTALSVTNTNSGKVYFAKASLAAVTPSKIIRFRIKLTDTGDAGDAVTWHRELVAFTVSFSMTNETQKKAWGLTVNGSNFIETLDAEFSEATVESYTPSEVRDQLWSWANAQTVLVLKDLDGSDYNVKIEAFRELMPVIGPDEGGEPEAQFALTLLEV